MFFGTYNCYMRYHMGWFYICKRKVDFVNPHISENYGSILLPIEFIFNNYLQGIIHTYEIVHVSRTNEIIIS